MNSFFMRFFKKMAALALLLGGIQSSHGFAFVGPFEAYQVPALGYLAGTYIGSITYGDNVALGDLGGPHNLGEEFRRNTPVMYYSCDAPFWEYFGSNGVAAVDQACGVINSLTNVSAYSEDLSEFPLKSQQLNFEAQDLFLTDVKSMTLHLLVEQLGLSQPERFVWTLHARTMGTPCPLAGLYHVVKRNYDVLIQTPLSQTPYSSYINGVLYTYGIVEYCTGTPIAEAIAYPVDPTAEVYTSVAADPGSHQGITFIGGAQGINPGGVGLKIGGFYTYLTRDDMAGLRYLLRKDNYNTEASGTGTVQFVTNNTPVLLTNSFDLGLLASVAPTNSAAALQALFPGLLVEDTTNWFKLAFSTNFVFNIVPAPFAPAGTVQVVITTNVEPTVIQYFKHNFLNVVTNFNTYAKHSVYRTQIVSPGGAPFAVAGTPPSLKTNTSGLLLSKNISGSFFILPTNNCGIKIIQSLYTNVVATTNLIASTTLTNSTGSNQTYTVSTITYFTNNWLVYLPITCPENTIGLRQGVERIQFKRRDFDSLIGTFWEPATNRYTLYELTNNTLRPQLIERVVNRPDFLFSVQDQGGANNFNGTVLRNLGFNQAISNGVVSGPGTLVGPTTFSFNKIGDSYWNIADFNLFNSSLFFISDESSAVKSLLWASFDGTTNTPVVFPNRTSLGNFLNQIFIQVSTQPAATVVSGIAQLPAGTRGASYLNTLTASGGQAPYTWSLAPGSGGLPGGLNFVASTNSSSINLSTGVGVVTGAAATYDFTIRVTDSASRSVDVPFELTINP
ncbi:MAG: putative Ig domain-containing protein [Verrucomicrobiota bacterium]